VQRVVEGSTVMETRARLHKEVRDDVVHPPGKVDTAAAHSSRVAMVRRKEAARWSTTAPVRPLRIRGSEGRR
jgi:hypothetical protein